MPGRIYFHFKSSTKPLFFFGSLFLGIVFSGCYSSVPPASQSKDKNYKALTAFSDSQKLQLETATKAKDKLGMTLMSQLMQSFAKDGASGTIDFCKKKAPEFAESVGKELDVKVGRTSFKIRNSQNQPPEWATSFVKEKTPHQTFVALENESLGALFPIKINTFCLNCHGEKDKLAEGVAEALAKNYPNDQATGFQDKELRGYFWVEVPKAR